MSVPLRSNYDMTLNIGGKNYGYLLAEDENGVKHWNEGLAPLITPQQRVTEFSYEHIPPEIDVPAAFESWKGGAGTTEFSTVQNLNTGFVQPNSNMPTVYNYSTGVDASWDNRLYLSPKPQRSSVLFGASLGISAMAAYAPKFFNSAQSGLFAYSSSGNAYYIWKFNLPGNAWVLAHTTTAAVTSMAEVSGVIYASISGVAYVYSTDGGNVWTTYTGATLNSASIADYFTVRENVLFAMRSEKAYVTVNGQNGGTAWSSGTVIGNTSETTQSAIVANNLYWVFKKQGVYAWNGTDASVQVWSADYITSTNGTNPYVWYDGCIYVVYGSRILFIDPFDSTTTLKFVFPKEVSTDNATSMPHDSLEIKGSISQISGTFNDLIFTITETQDSNVYLMKGDPVTQVYHTYADLGVNTNSGTIAVGPGVVHATNPCIVTAAWVQDLAFIASYNSYFILPREDLRPQDDTNYEYTSTGTIYGPWMSFGARSFNKFLNSGSVLGTGITAGCNVTLSYQLDDDTDNTYELVDAIDYIISSSNVSGTVSFYRIRYVITMNTIDENTTPIMIGATLHSTLNPPRRRMWKPMLSLKPNQPLRDSTLDNQDVNALRQALYGAAEQRITMTDRENNSFVVRLLDIQEASLKFSTEGGFETDNQIIQISLAEIAAISSSLQVARYNQARYTQSYRYGDE